MSPGKLQRSRWFDFVLAFSFAFLVAIILGFIYVEDVQKGIGVLCSQVIEWAIPDLMM